ncbi:uncharacterized protein LAESUDRAFT_763417 [Laetiporus sulphureus 93-53]|uniref:CCHC-type domain-containing protein n=1 Tax=Laetiporus sulphureus 93-53 TaxID=1314785 RepID=A0A165BXG2_9APHY|nr:uncharacterized protein LAESUDRAFT_763417 [Laetiporus sulphureus 93-53]KZT01830.1 hypothetical protein LAESUDRAFT_763417 [Laetiporus sulphureus 93-53]
MHERHLSSDDVQILTWLTATLDQVKKNLNEYAQEYNEGHWKHLNWGLQAIGKVKFIQLQANYLRITRQLAEIAWVTPVDADAQEEWDDDDQQALGIIMVWTQQKLHSHLKGVTHVLDAWEKLKTVYGTESVLGTWNLVIGYMNTQMDDSKSLQQQIDDLETQRNCPYPPSYSNVLVNLLVGLDLTTVKPQDLILKIIDEENHRKEESIGRISQVTRKGPCGKCGKAGHTTEQHVDNWQPKRKNQGNAKGKVPANKQGKRKGKGSNGGTSKSAATPSTGTIVTV